MEFQKFNVRTLYLLTIRAVYLLKQLPLFIKEDSQREFTRAQQNAVDTGLDSVHCPPVKATLISYRNASDDFTTISNFREC